MAVNILIITHEDIGAALLSAATMTLGELPLPTTVVSVNYDTDPEHLVQHLQKIAADLTQHQELLILTDLYGSTPSNIAQSLGDKDNIRVVSGLNLPMLIRLMNYANQSLDVLAQKALSGGKDGVINCSEK